MNPEINNLKPRNPWLAFLFALFIPGLGQIYNGQIKKGVIILTIVLILPFIFGITGLGIYFYGFATIAAIDLLFRIYVIYDAVHNARRQNNYVLQPYNKWYYYLVYTFGIWSVLGFYDTNSVLGIESFKISATANEPTLIVGDKIVANLNAFKNKTPTYGDIVIFTKKDSLKPWLYRVVGIPNDTIIVQNNFLTINGKKCQTKFINESSSENIAVNKYWEELPNGFKHNIYTDKQTVPKRATFIVPAESYFLMGDNRDNAKDSRYIGNVKRDEIKGKVVFSWWGNTKDRINLELRNK